MITVVILINGNPILARSATNTGHRGKGYNMIYKVDGGLDIEHDPDDGAVALAHKLLDTIKMRGK